MNNQETLSLREASKMLSVSVETLLMWNENNILKPIITADGNVGYRMDQIEHFSSIKNSSHDKPANRKQVSRPTNIFPLYAMLVSFVVTSFLSQTILFALDSSKTNIQDPTSVVVSNYPPVIEDPRSEISIEPGKDNSKLYEQVAFKDNINYAQLTNYSTDRKQDTSVFDEQGNITGQSTDPRLLATNILTPQILGEKTTPIQNSINLPLWIVIFTIILLPLLLRKSSNSSINNDLSAQKVIELDQKTDGSIVLVIDNREFKISRPELDSESDQFIDRLMQLASSDKKEVDYDVFNDSHLQFNAPLSKLVTRLGFVGIKRDLFFPRTSKSRVLFRKYVSYDDLQSLNLSVDKVTQSLLSLA